MEKVVIIFIVVSATIFLCSMLIGMLKTLRIIQDYIDEVQKFNEENRDWINEQLWKSFLGEYDSEKIIG